MRVEVYETEGEALEAVAEMAAHALAARPAGPLAAALPGGRCGRALMPFLAARVDLPWEQTRFCVVHEIADADRPANRDLLREHLLVPRGLATGAADAGDPVAAWEDALRSAAGTPPAFDLLVLELGPAGEIGVLGPGAPEPAADVNVVRTPAGVGLGPAALARARRVVVVATGGERSGAFAAALREGGAAAGPARQVLPSDRVTWICDRAAAAELLRAAAPAA